MRGRPGRRIGRYGKRGKNDRCDHRDR
jgi:hypothetical protein